MKLRDTSRKSLQAGQSSCHATEMEGQESPRTSPDIREVENFSIVLIGSIIKDLFWAFYFSGKTEEKTCRLLWHRLRVLGKQRRRRKGACPLNLNWGLMTLIRSPSLGLACNCNFSSRTNKAKTSQQQRQGHLSQNPHQGQFIRIVAMKISMTFFR